MAENIKAIKVKIKTIGSLKKITRAMEMVARSKMKKAIDGALASRPYTEKALELLVSLPEEETVILHPLLAEGKGENILIIHIASDKGLCGSYNVQSFRNLEKFARNEKNLHIVSVGKYGIRHGEKVGGFLLQSFKVNENISIANAEEITNFVIDRFLTDSYSKVFISYTNFENVFSQIPTIRQILPISREALISMYESTGQEEDKKKLEVENRKELIEYKFEPSPQEVLVKILPHLALVQIYQALLEAQASEQSARMVAMKSATDNAQKLGEELTLRYNRARQAGITNEIIEVATGAEALK